MSLFLTGPILHWRYSKFTNYFTKSTKLKNSLIKRRLNNGNSSIQPEISHEATNLEEKNKFVPFIDMVNTRRAEAKRSILVQVQSSKSFNELHSYCSSIGNVKQMFHYKSGVEPLHFIVVEFTNESDVANILSESSHVEDTQAVPIHSQFLWFKASSRKLSKLKQNKNQTLTVENGNNIMNEDDIRILLQKCENISDQMNLLYNNTKLNDLGTRLRFLTARQIEVALNGMFPNACALPFGSSVNGYGKMGCDLDLVLRLSNDQIKNDGRLIFHCKAASGSERTTSQRNMEVLGDLIQLFLPGCAQVRRILQARVPIIKYYQQLTDVECDLSMSNTSGFHMSDFLYIMASIDDRVRPLVFTIKKWANEIGLTNASPGRWITNFSLTLLVLAFLQKPINSTAILPSLNLLIQKSEPKDKYYTEDGINCTFLRNIEKLNKLTQNRSSLEFLLCEFFEFYSQFDFASKAICLNDANAIRKPEHSALYIVNPLERGLNVSKNVSFEELERFQTEARNAAWILESQENKSNNWGLLSILDSKKKNVHPLNFALPSKHGRLVEVSALFEEEGAPPIDYKNEAIKRQVNNIKRDAQSKIKEIHKLQR